MDDTTLIVLWVIIILKIALWTTICACRRRRRAIYVRQHFPVPASPCNIISQNHAALSAVPCTLQVTSPSQNGMQGFVNPGLYMPQPTVGASIPRVGACEPPPYSLKDEGCAFPSPPDYSDS